MPRIITAFNPVERRGRVVGVVFGGLFSLSLSLSKTSRWGGVGMRYLATRQEVPLERSGRGVVGGTRRAVIAFCATHRGERATNNPPPHDTGFLRHGNRGHVHDFLDYISLSLSREEITLDNRCWKGRRGVDRGLFHRRIK